MKNKQGLGVKLSGDMCYHIHLQHVNKVCTYIEELLAKMGFKLSSLILEYTIITTT